MTSLQLVDSAEAVPPAAAVAAGIAGVIRYVSQEPSKNLTAEEAAGYLAAGLTVTAVYEDGTTDYTGGEAGGEQHGQVAMALLDAIGYPTDRALYAAVDTQIPETDYPTGLAYVVATCAASGRMGGVYGPDAFVRYCMSNGVTYGFNAAGWSDGVANAAQIQQEIPQVDLGGTTCDTDVASAADYGQWPYTPPQPPPPVSNYLAATARAGTPGVAWFLQPDGEVDGRDVVGASEPTFGDVKGDHLFKPPVGVTSSPSGGGYWIVAADGGVFCFGDAQFHGSAADLKLNKPVVALLPGSDGAGYALVASDGGVFSYGDLRFKGSTASLSLDAPMVGGATAPSENGYWLVAADGGVFTFGGATFHGASPAPPSTPRACAMSACGAGYVVLRVDGSVEAFGTPFQGDYPGLPPGRREGVRKFVGIAGGTDGSYTLFGSDGTQYYFG
jgi:hypothetical protein